MQAHPFSGAVSWNFSKRCTVLWHFRFSLRENADWSVMAGSGMSLSRIDVQMFGMRELVLKL